MGIARGVIFLGKVVVLGRASPARIWSQIDVEPADDQRRLVLNLPGLETRVEKRPGGLVLTLRDVSPGCGYRSNASA